MDVEDISTPPDEAFMVEAIVPSKRVLIEVIDIADLPKGVLGIASPLVTSSYTKIVDAKSSFDADLQARLIGTTFSIVDFSTEEPYAPEVKEAKVYAKEDKAHALGVA